MAFRLALETIGDKSVRAISRDEVRELRRTVQALLPNFSCLDGRTLRAIIEAAEPGRLLGQAVRSDCRCPRPLGE